jgi:hypothetical protein
MIRGVAGKAVALMLVPAGENSRADFNRFALGQQTDFSGYLPFAPRAAMVLSPIGC